MSGQLQDTFAGGGNGVHGEIDCLNVNGIEAVVGGLITNGSADGDDWTGQRFLTALVDLGTSSTEPDLISFTFNNTGAISCHELSAFNFPLFHLWKGQVKVWDN